MNGFNVINVNEYLHGGVNTKLVMLVLPLPLIFPVSGTDHNE